MSGKLILLIAVVVVFAAIVYFGKGPWKYLVVTGLVAVGLIGLLMWSGRLTIPELIEAIKEFVGA